MAISQKWTRNLKNVEMVLTHYRDPTDLKVKDIAALVGTTHQNVGAVIRTHLSEAERKALAARRYRNEKLGAKNPMHGKTGASHHNHKGDCDDGYGYLTRLHQGKRQFVHRIVMAKLLGVERIPTKLIVHHIDGDQRNNNPDNLALMTNVGHRAMHTMQAQEARRIATGESPLERRRRLNYEQHKKEPISKDRSLNIGSVLD